MLYKTSSVFTIGFSNPAPSTPNLIVCILNLSLGPISCVTKTFKQQLKENHKCFEQRWNKISKVELLLLWGKVVPVCYIDYNLYVILISN